MGKELDAGLKTINTLINVEKILIDELLKALEVLLKDRENYSKVKVDNLEKMKTCAEGLKDHLLNGGTFTFFKCSKSDKELISQVLDSNDQAFIKMQQGDNKEFIGEYSGNHFAFDYIFSKNENDENYKLLIKNTDLAKFNDLKNYLDEKKYKNTIQMIEKNVKDVLKIDKSKKLMTLNIPDDAIYKEIANVLNSSKIPFEVANEEHSVSIVYEKEHENDVIHAIASCKNIGEKERAFLIAVQNKEFNNRSESAKQVDKMINDSPTLADLIKKTENKGNNNAGRD